MKKNVFCLILAFILIFLVLFITHHDSNNGDILRGTSWERETDVDLEILSFHEDGGFAYYYGVGNPVYDSDLCDSYKYDSDKNIIRVHCNGKNVLNSIKVVSISDTSITVVIDGKEATFSKKIIEDGD